MDLFTQITITCLQIEKNEILLCARVQRIWRAQISQIRVPYIKMARRHKANGRKETIMASNTRLRRLQATL